MEKSQAITTLVTCVVHSFRNSNVEEISRFEMARNHVLYSCRARRGAADSPVLGIYAMDILGSSE